MTNQSICCDSALASSVLADAETYFWIDFSQGESVAESGSIIRHYFRTHFSLYVMPRRLSLAIICVVKLDIVKEVNCFALLAYLAAPSV